MENSTWIKAGSALVTIALLLGSAMASACQPQFNETWVLGGSAQWVGAGDECALEASLTGVSPAAATVHFRRQHPAAPLRLSFRVNPPVPTLNSVSAFTVARGTADRVPAGGPAEAALFQLILTGNLPGTAVRMGILAACSSEASGLCGVIVQDPVTFPLKVTVELDVGDGPAGRLRYWAGDASGPPTATIENLDNARWIGVDRVSLGLSDPGDQLAALLNGGVVVFDDILVDEDSLFWSDFERGAGYPVASNQPAFPSFPTSQVVSGNTCGGVTSLPVLASGSTSVRGPKDIYPFALGGETYRTFAIASDRPRMRVFVCEEGVSTTSRCISASGADSVPAYLGAVGNYQIVIGDMADGCGAYSLIVGGPLGSPAD